MENIVLSLKAGTSAVLQNGMAALCLGGRTQPARDPLQAALIRTLSDGPRTVEALTTFVHARGGPQCTEADAALTLAGFILDFKEYLES